MHIYIAHPSASNITYNSNFINCMNLINFNKFTN
jgi:hypothetical protein